MAFGFVIISMIFVLAMLAGVAGLMAVGRGSRRDRDGNRLEPASLAEIGRLREDVDRLSGEVQRLHEEQSFMVNLLGEAEKKRLLEGPPKDG